MPGEVLEELNMCQSPIQNARYLILVIFRARNEQMSHAYHGGVTVEMQQFDKHGYYFCNLLCCIYYDATVCMSTMLMKTD